jgi:hypothetical protein
MKLPTSLGQKKVKAVEQMLQEIGIEVTPGKASFQNFFVGGGKSRPSKTYMFVWVRYTCSCIALKTVVAKSSLKIPNSIWRVS